MARRPKSPQPGPSDRDSPATPSLEAILGHAFTNPALLTLALTHRSFVYDAAQAAASPITPAPAGHPSNDNEQLEFLGDAILGLVAAEALCQRFPGSREGELTRLRAAVVSRKHLGEVGTRLGLGRFLRLGHTAEKNQGRTNVTLFANAIEALIAAMYLDAGLEPVRRFVEAEILPGALTAAEPGQTLPQQLQDHKSALQEILQAQARPRPSYHLLTESGPAHRPLFRVEVRLEGQALAAAEASTKKAAEQQAARLAVALLTDAPEPLHA